MLPVAQLPESFIHPVALARPGLNIDKMMNDIYKVLVSTNKQYIAYRGCDPTVSRADAALYRSGPVTLECRPAG